MLVPCLKSPHGFHYVEKEIQSSHNGPKPQCDLTPAYLSARLCLIPFLLNHAQGLYIAALSSGTPFSQTAAWPSSLNSIQASSERLSGTAPPSKIASPIISAPFACAPSPP